MMSESTRHALRQFALGVTVALLLTGLVLAIAYLSGRWSPRAALKAWLAADPVTAAGLPAFASQRPANAPPWAGAKSPIFIPGATFQDIYGTAETNMRFQGPLYSAGLGGGAGPACAYAPAFLPDGARVSRLTADFLDNYGPDDAWLQLNRVSLTSGSWTNMAIVYATTDSAGIREYFTETIADPIIDNGGYGYDLYTCFNPSATGQTHRLYAASIDFVHNAFLPAVLRKECGEFPGPQEDEVGGNDTAATANGSICLDRNYTGLPNNDAGNEEDWFYYDWDGSGTLAVDLTGFLAHEWLILYYQDPTVPANLLASDHDPDGNGIYHVEDAGSKGPGRYYIRVLAQAASRPGNAYTLRASLK